MPSAPDESPKKPIPPHHIKLGRHLKERMDELGIECHVIGGSQAVKRYIDKHAFLIE